MNRQELVNRQELAEQVNLAYDDYFNAIQELGTEAGIMPPSPRLVQDDPRTSARALELWADFQAEQDRINQEYSDAIEAKHAKDSAS